jgi:hypothetical protein
LRFPKKCLAMYWYKTRGAVTGMLMVALWLAACHPDVKETAALKYFDIKGYFAKDSIFLTRLNKPVFKTVTHNGVTESKEVHIANWGQELSLFKEADINRPAWKNSYTIIANDDVTLYKAKYPELKMREMIIKTDKNQVKWILIFNKTKNILYQTTEKLSYFPDSLYLIEKVQKVRLMGINNYRIQGVLSR